MKIFLNPEIFRETVYVSKNIAEDFHLINFKNVIVNKVQRSSVALDVVELLFKASLIIWINYVSWVYRLFEEYFLRESF